MIGPTGLAGPAGPPPELAVGVGVSSGVTDADVLEVIRQTLDGAGLPMYSLGTLATVDAKANDPGLIAAAEQLGVPLRTYSAAALSHVTVPNPAAAALAAVGTPSVCEAAALLAADADHLLLPKTKPRPAGGDGSPRRVTVAVARHRPHRRHVEAEEAAAEPESGPAAPVAEPGSGPGVAPAAVPGPVPVPDSASDKETP